MKETHQYNVYEDTTYKRSLINGMMIVDRVIFRCPRCKSPQEPLPHNEWVSCGTCALTMKRIGNALELIP